MITVEVHAAHCRMANAIMTAVLVTTLVLTRIDRIFPRAGHWLNMYWQIVLLLIDPDSIFASSFYLTYVQETRLIVERKPIKHQTRLMVVAVHAIASRPYCYIVISSVLFSFLLSLFIRNCLDVVFFCVG